MIRSYDREGTQAFQRQNLDLAITKWDRILELDPGNQKAKLERERCLDLKQKMSGEIRHAQVSYFASCWMRFSLSSATRASCSFAAALRLSGS